MTQRLKRFLELFPREHVHVELYDDVLGGPEAVVRRVYEFLGVRGDFVPGSLRKKIHSRPQTRLSWLRRLVNRTLTLLQKSGLKKIASRLTSSRALYRLYCQVNLSHTAAPPMKAETRQQLKEFYRSDILELQRLIGRDLSAWL